MPLVTLDSTATVDEAIAVIERDGGVIIRDFVDSQTLAGLKSDLHPVLENLGWGDDDFFAGKKTRRLGGLFKHTEHGTAIVRQPHFRAAADHFLARPVYRWVGDEKVELTPTYQVGATQVIDIHPGEGAQPLHRDDMVWSWRHGEGEHQARVQVMVAVTDFTADNGGTLVVPGSHLWDDERAPLREEAVPTEMNAGSALVWIGGTYHAGGTNNTESARTGITVTLDLAYLRQEENQYLAMNLEEVKALPDDVARLIGYQACPPLLGWVERDGIMRDPHMFLEDPADLGTSQATIGKRQAV
ncbi:phytanoyl-CoA dioxygenase family protein [Mycolicibacterium wolinskyi]|uniref:Phytanoyl-CoA dioxygenase n=1 Tax=Mycolicibacterium wolinskyi TaxID=59750 RepID=A0A1X2F219_9MYCO|nr:MULTISPECIES: phytanoyl-CoA dioxygenase family protein [Mycolicibacterium]MCV7287815.1 phytanoyl-CoA dioxygenase family protein [Mycolicibacterium wolinskyi]MCV7294713.1 phytanoyl-CoA dioxygenase family protein [Mycolicibacterium goodii]ORX12426.1 phytanoyl-CoA dioxygenase [Mycolicibacterium wolinskyi]